MFGLLAGTLGSGILADPRVCNYLLYTINRAVAGLILEFDAMASRERVY